MSLEVEFTKDNIPKNITLYALPLIAGSMMQMIFNVADSAIIGNYVGKEALAAVGSSVSITSTIFSMFNGLASGSAIVYGKYRGSNDDDSASKTVHTTLFISLFVGIIFTLLGLFFTKDILELTKCPQEILPLAVSYLRIYLIGSLFSVIVNYASAMIRVSGFVRIVLYISLITGGLKVALNVIFVISLKLNVQGAALATALANLISVAVLLFIMLDKKILVFNKIAVDKTVLKEIVKQGVPVSIQTSLFALSNVIVQSAINSLGTDVIAANTAAGYIETFIYHISSSFAQSEAIFITYNYGARNKENIKKAIKFCFTICIISTLVLGVASYFTSDYLLRIIVSSETVFEIGKMRLLCCEVPYILWGLLDGLQGVMKGLSHSLSSMIISLLGICGTRILWITTYFASHKDVISLYICYPLSWLVTVIITYIFVRKYWHKDIKFLDK